MVQTYIPFNTLGKPQSCLGKEPLQKKKSVVILNTYKHFNTHSNLMEVSQEKIRHLDAIHIIAY